MTDPNNKDEKAAGLSWPRIGGVAFAMALHVAGFMMLMAPVSAPPPPEEEEQVVPVSFTDPPPPPPPPPPPEEKPVVITTVVNTPRPTVLPPPPAQDPVIYNDPTPNDTVAAVITPPTIQAPVIADSEATEDISGRALNPPKYPAAEQRDGIGGTVRVKVSIDANGNVLEVSIEKTSRNRNLDRAAMEAARKWKFNPKISGGRKVPGVVIVPVEFSPPPQ